MANEPAVNALKQQADLAQAVLREVQDGGVQVIRAGNKIAGFAVLRMQSLAQLEALGLHTDLLNSRTAATQQERSAPEALAFFSGADLQKALGSTAIVEEMLRHILHSKAAAGRNDLPKR